jgi:hypothetical protein
MAFGSDTRDSVRALGEECPNRAVWPPHLAKLVEPEGL